ncbi:MAG TPA: DUF72 domain-containing protein [Planctomycetes bacterium]|nr:DUF72 domain-containing protein [Planctomycetota bacterium]
MGTKGKRSHPVHLGTMGWNHPDWVGPFYSDPRPGGRWLSQYCKQFSVVEVQVPFPQGYKKDLLAQWSRSTPMGFLFCFRFPWVAVKEALLGRSEPLYQLLDRFKVLGGHLGPFVFPVGQIEGVEKEDLPDLLAPFLKAWKKRYFPLFRLGLELTTPRLWTKGILGLMRRSGVGMVVNDVPWTPDPDQILGRSDLLTAGFSYIRLVGHPRELPGGGESPYRKPLLDRTWKLKGWADWIRKAAWEMEVFALSANSFSGYAPYTSRELRRILLEGE